MSFSMLRVYGDYKMSQLLKEVIIFLLEQEIESLSGSDHAETDEAFGERRRGINKATELLEKLKNE